MIYLTEGFGSELESKPVHTRKKIGLFLVQGKRPRRAADRARIWLGGHGRGRAVVGPPSQVVGSQKSRFSASPEMG